MAQKTSLQVYALAGRVHTFSAKTAGGGELVWTSYGVPFLYTAANWGTVVIYLQTYMKATSGTVYSRLYDTTSSAAVASSELSTAATSYTRSRSSALTLTDGHIYMVQHGTTGAGETRGDELIII